MTFALKDGKLEKNKEGVQLEKCSSYYFCKIDRIAAWGLFVTMFLYFISGYGMTKGIINSSHATNIHNNLLPIIFVVFFTVHTSYAIRLAFMRWRIWNLFTKILLVLFYLGIISSFIYLDQIYLNNKNTTNSSNANQTEKTTRDEDSEENEIEDDDENVIDSSTITSTQQAPSTSTSKTFTTVELSQFNGKNGQPAYLAIDGSVYDLSKVFVNGFHFGHPAGVDLTSAFYSKHVKSQITKYPMVGTLK